MTTCVGCKEGRDDHDCAPMWLGRIDFDVAGKGQPGYVTFCRFCMEKGSQLARPVLYFDARSDQRRWVRRSQMQGYELSGWTRSGLIGKDVI
jgi:hypothetical protein